MNRPVACTVDLVPLAQKESVVPDPGRLIFALRQIGYSLEQALSDLIDNAISAGARNVLIRFIWKDEVIVAIAVADDGRGMTSEELLNAMRFGSAERLDRTSLGKFGLGLKLASFSHARVLTVVCSRDSAFSGRRWTLVGESPCSGYETGLPSRPFAFRSATAFTPRFAPLRGHGITTARALRRAAASRHDPYANNGMVHPAPPTGPARTQFSTSAVETELAEQTNERT